MLNPVTENYYFETAQRLRSIFSSAGINFTLISHLGAGNRVLDVYQYNDTKVSLQCSATEEYPDAPLIYVYSDDVEFRSNLLCLLSKFFDKVALN